MKQMLKRQMKNMPKDQQEKMMKLIEENPDLFMKIAEETQEEMRGGKDQMSAAMSVMSRHKEVLQKIYKQ